MRRGFTTGSFITSQQMRARLAKMNHQLLLLVKADLNQKISFLFSLNQICDDNSGMIGIPFRLITIVSKVVDPMTGLSIISICSSSTNSPLIAYPSLSIVPRRI